jgi:hypothetical protein
MYVYLEYCLRGAASIGLYLHKELTYLSPSSHEPFHEYNTEDHL